MQRLPLPLRLLVNHYAFIFLPLIPLAILVAILGQNGWSVVDLVILAIAVTAFVLYWATQHARQSDNVPANPQTLMTEIEQSGKYAMLAFESEFCFASTQVGKQLNQLEETYPDKFQIYKISILDDPGKDLFKQYEGKVTPTYVLLNPQGQVMMDWPLVLPVERVSYALKQQEAQK